MSPVLDGIRVLDFGRYIAGPYCATLLADSAAWWIGSAVLTAVPLAVLGWQILRDARRPAPGQESGAARRA